ncbi:MAG: hypothetical protein CVV24_13415, partial [Ignavibacteriae bacterium HGW-Ignavibacteriae-3]
MSNPFISNKKIRALYFSIWFIISLAQVLLLTFFLNVKLVNAFYDSFIFNILYMALGLSFWFTVSFNSLENYSTAKVFLNHIAAAVITSGLWILLGYYIILNLLSADKTYIDFLLSSLIWRFLTGILFYIVIIAVDYVIIYYTNFQEKLLKEAELNALVKESELKTLKYQINPHFIFNSLNSISSLTISNPPQAQEMTIKLSSFLRSILSKNEKQKNKLSEEISNARL